MRKLAKLETYICPKCKTATLAFVKTSGKEKKLVYKIKGADR